MDSLIDALYPFFVEKLPYITISVFFLGVALRLVRWMNAPKGEEGTHLSITAAVKYVILDLVFFRKTFKEDKITWAAVFLFHVAAGGILFGHMRGFHLWSEEMFTPLGEGVAKFMVQILPVYMGWIFIATQIFLLVRRAALEGRQLLSLPNDYLSLLLLLITSILGQGMRVFPPEAIPSETYSVVFIPGFIVLHLEKVPSFHWFFWHILFTQLFIMYIPFSKLVHIFTGVISSALYGSRRSEYGL